MENNQAMQIDTVTKQNEAIIICARVSRTGSDMSLELQRLQCTHYIKDTGRENLHVDSIQIVHSSQDLQWLTHKAGENNKWTEMNDQYSTICSQQQFTKLTFMFSCVDRFLRQNITESVVLKLLINLQEWTRRNNLISFEFVDEKKSLEFTGDEHYSQILAKFEHIKTELQAATIEFDQIRKRQKRSRDFLQRLGYKFGKCPKCFDVVFVDIIPEGSQEPVRIRKFQLKPAIIKLLVATGSDVESLVQLQTQQFRLFSQMGLVNQQMEEQIQSNMREYLKPLIIKAKRVRQQVLKQMGYDELRAVIAASDNIGLTFSTEEMVIINEI